MGLFNKFRRKKEETINTDGHMIISKYRFNQHQYIRITIEDMGASGIEGLDKDQLTEKLLYFYDNMLPVEERIRILMNTFDIDRETAKKVEYVSFAKTSLIADYLYHKERGATKFSIVNANKTLKSNLSIKDYVKNVGFMISNDGIPVFNIKTNGFRRWTPNNTSPKSMALEKPKKEPENLTELDILINRETELHHKLDNEEGYYGSDISREEFRKFNNDVATYLENNPKDFITRGARYSKVLLEYINRASKDELKIFELLGKGLYYETDLEDYDKAIEIYNEVDVLNKETFKSEIMELVRDYGDRDYLYSAKAKDRINICNNKKKRIRIKELEAKANELSETNPKEAINIYNQLNELNPDVQKYNKAIFKIREFEAEEIAKTNTAEAIKIYEELNMLNPDIKKYDRAIIKISEAEAKELELTDPSEAIKKYEELNILNPGLKKYNKRIEICKKKLN